MLPLLQASDQVFDEKNTFSFESWNTSANTAAIYLLYYKEKPL